MNESDSDSYRVFQDQLVSPTTSRIYRLRRTSSTPLFTLNVQHSPTSRPVQSSSHVRSHSHRSSGSSEIMAQIFENDGSTDIGNDGPSHGNRPRSVGSVFLSDGRRSTSVGSVFLPVDRRSPSFGSIPSPLGSNSSSPTTNLPVVTYHGHPPPPGFGNSPFGPIGGERASAGTPGTSSRLAPPGFYQQQKSKSLSEVDFDPGTMISHDYSALHENLKSEPPISLQDARDLKAGNKQMRKDVISFIKERTRFRVAEMVFTSPSPVDETFKMPRVETMEGKRS